MGVKVGSGLIFHQEKLDKPGYAIEVADTGGAAGGAAVADTPPDWGTVLPKADLASGEKTFGKCTSCHNNAQGGPNMTGPNLWGVVGRPTASHAGMSYSDGMMAHAKEAPNWTYDQIYMFLGGPQKWVKGTKMTFAGVKKPEDRINLIAYLRSQGSTGYAIPAADPSRAAGAAPAASGTAAPATAASGTAAPAAPASAAAAHSAAAVAAGPSASGSAASKAPVAAAKAPAEAAKPAA